MKCPSCGGPAVRVEQTSLLSCVGQCDQSLPDMAKRIALEERTAATARALKEAMPDGVGFCLVMFDFYEGSMAYASTGQRADAISMLQELVDKLRADPATHQQRDGKG